VPSANELAEPIQCLFARPGLADLQLAISPLTHLLCDNQESFFLLLNRMLHLQTPVQRNPTIPTAIEIICPAWALTWF
jgi:hypothetical protein